MGDAAWTTRHTDPIFESYVALASGLVGNLTGICLLDGSLELRGCYGVLTGDAVAKWIRSRAGQ